MSFVSRFASLLGYPDGRFSFGASWAHQGPAWVLFGVVALCSFTVLYYLRWQPRGTRPIRITLAVCRSIVLSMILLMLAEPIVERTIVRHPKPLLWVLFDGSESMAIEDEFSDVQRQELDEAVDMKGFLAAQSATPDASKPPKESVSAPKEKGSKPTRVDYIRALVEKSDNNLLKKLGEKYRLQAYVFDRPDGVRSVKLSEESPGNQTKSLSEAVKSAVETRSLGEIDAPEPIDPQLISRQITSEGTVTALGAALDDLALRHATGNLSGVLVVSDFEQNSGPAPMAAARRLGVPISTLGIGPKSAADLAVEVQTTLKMKKSEQSSVSVTLRQHELDGKQAHVKVTARPIEGMADASQTIVIGERTVALDSALQSMEFPFTPEETGRFAITVETDKLEGEIVDQNNRAEREVTIIDDFMRLLYVEYEPTWEWRFVKEVFHRDKLVGMRGFRTFLSSSDPNVRRTNELFVQSLTPPRSEFFQYDVIFLGDMPAGSGADMPGTAFRLSNRFCEMAKEFVSQFGGGLVVIAGPRFGPGQLAGTPLADMLPVIVDPDSRVRDEREFTLKLTPMASQYDFMRLGTNDAENEKGWGNLGRLSWYQRVKRIEPSATTVLAQHPDDKCDDGRTPQPLIAIRKYGRGEVVYIAFDEMWRLRRKYGEQYYRQFWGQMIHRLGLSHALGSQKRFVVNTDRQQYQSDDKVLVTVEAYNEDFEPLSEEDVPEKRLHAELIRPSKSSDARLDSAALSISQVRPGVFEARVPVFEGGEYRLRVTDPVSKEPAEVHFNVASVSVERRSAVRNAALQENIAAETKGRSYELTSVQNILTDFDPKPKPETTVEIEPLWNSWLWFGLVVGLLMFEWLVRKLARLT
jgi:hypothetical protein